MKSLQAFQTMKLNPEEISLRAKELPRLSDAARVLLEIIDDPYTGRDQISRVVAVDPVLLTKVLSLVHSAAFGLRRRLSSINEVIDYLGLLELKKIAMMVALRDYFTDPEFWFRTVFVANASERFSKDLNLDMQTGFMAYLLGLFHSYGLSAMVKFYPQDYQPILLESNPYKRLEMEKQVFAYNHIEFAAELLEANQIPVNIVEQMRALADRTSKNYDRVHALVELASYLYKFRLADTEQLQSALIAEPQICELINKFKLESLQIDSNLLESLFDRAEILSIA